MTLTAGLVTLYTAVAKRLADIAAPQPDRVPAGLQRWKTSGRVTGEQFAFLVRNT